MELQDISTGILLAQAGFATGMARAAAAKAGKRADDSFIAASISSASADAHAQSSIDLRGRLIGAEGEIERLRGRLDDAAEERRELLAAVRCLLDENDSLRALVH